MTGLLRAARPVMLHPVHSGKAAPGPMRMTLAPLRAVQAVLR